MLARPEAARPRNRGPSVPARPKLKFQWEQFTAILPELPPLFLEHWREIALNQDSIPLEPNYRAYLQMEAAGVLHVLTARRKGELVGYVFSVVMPHLHYASTPYAIGDMFYLQPAYRRGWNGVRLFRAFEQGVRERGARVIHLSEKLHFIDTHNARRPGAKPGFGVGSLLEFLGYNAIETVWSKRLG